MKFEEEKIKIATKLLNTEDKAIINDIKVLLKSYENDPWDEMPQMVKEDIIKGLDEAENGLGRPHNEVIRDTKEWLKK